MDQPPPYAPAPAPGFGSAPGFPGYQSYPPQPFYYQASSPPPPPPAAGSWDTPKNTVYLVKQEERSSGHGFGSPLASLGPGLGSGLVPGFGSGSRGGLKSFLEACSAALCCCCLWNLLHR
ncbi:hypothetical protein NL108_005526 [Boleophthalmus pectinirostris]|nr:hypothetical protein NL108_005526 [Boleophthalmus pectinirostris]